jgi:kumamolisin
VNFALPPCGVTPRAQLERSADVEVLDGNVIGVVGTSAAAPDFAGLLALFGQSQGGVRLGNINYLIYTLAAANGNGAFFRQNIPGNNGLFATHPGFNEVLGNGTLIARNFALLPFSPVAGDPQTPSNP